MRAQTQEDGHRVLVKGVETPGVATSTVKGKRGARKRSSFWKSAQEQLTGRTADGFRYYFEPLSFQR